jgi:hypothetical protein
MTVMDEASQPKQYYDNEKPMSTPDVSTGPSYQPQQQCSSSTQLQQQQQQQDLQQQEQPQQQSWIYQEQEQQQLPKDPHFHRANTCPVPDHSMIALGNYGEPRRPSINYTINNRYHRGARDQEKEEELLLTNASRFRRIRFWIGKSIESKAAHIVILVLTLCDIILVMLQIGASLLHLDETEHEHWVMALFEHLSLAIISVFMLEILLKVFAFGPRYFWIGTRHWFLHVIDAVIIVTSFLLEIFLKGAKQELSNLLIIFRLWRVVKLTGTVAVEVSEHDLAHITLLEERIQSLEQELEESRLKIQRLEGFNIPHA